MVDGNIGSEIPHLSPAELATINLPKVEYSKSITSPECPYTIELDQQGVVELLKAAGVDQAKIKDITIEVTRRIGNPVTDQIKGGTTIGGYAPGKRKMTIFADSFWDQEQKWMETAGKILTTNTDGKTDLSPMPKNQKNKFKGMVSGRRLSWYLTIAPKERAAGIAQQLINKAAAKKLNSTIAHESKHVGENTSLTLSKLKSVASMVAGGVIGSEILAVLWNGRQIDGVYMGISLLLVGVQFANLGRLINYSILDTDESHARKFAEELSNDPRYRIATIISKQVIKASIR